MPGPARDAENVFKYHEPKPGQDEKYHALRDGAKAFDALITKLCPESRERALAYTKLEEALLWATSSVARNT